MRADTTVVWVDVVYPTDSGLLAKVIRWIAATARRVQAAGGARRTRLCDRSRAVGQRAHAIAAKLRLPTAVGREATRAAVVGITGELAGLAEQAAFDAQRLWANARRALRRVAGRAAALAATGGRDAAAGRRRGRSRRAVDDLTKLLAASRQIAAQARQRLTGITPSGSDAASEPARSPRPPDRQRPPR